MSLQDKIVVNVKRSDKGWSVTTQSGKIYGPFKNEYDMSEDPDIGQRALNWRNAQGGRHAPRFSSGDGYA